MACNANTVCFERSLRQLRRHHDQTKLSKFTLVDICGTNNPSIINNIPRETFDAQVDAMKRDIGLPVSPRVSESELAERRAERDAARAKRETETERTERLAQSRAATDAFHAAREAKAAQIQTLERPRTPDEERIVNSAYVQKKRDAEKEANGGETPTYPAAPDCPYNFEADRSNWPIRFRNHLTGKSQDPCTTCQAFALSVYRRETEPTGVYPYAVTVVRCAQQVQDDTAGRFRSSFGKRPVTFPERIDADAFEAQAEAAKRKAAWTPAPAVRNTRRRKVPPTDG